MHLNANSRGKTAKGSIRHSALSCSERKDNWDGQQIESRPRRVRVRAAPEEAEKRDQMVFAVCCSVAESVSRRYEHGIHVSQCNYKSYTYCMLKHTFCRSRRAPASTIR